MANTAAAVGTSTSCRAVFELTGDGTVAGPTIANSVILAGMAAGPLKTLWSTVHGDQAAMRAALFAGRGRMFITYRTSPAQVTTEDNLIEIDVDVDAVTASLPEINVSMSDTTGQVGYLQIEYVKDIP